jgi:CheY-like chemotaxis protein
MSNEENAVEEGIADHHRKIMVVEPDDERRETMVNILKELLQGCTVTDIEDVDDAKVLLEEDMYDTVVCDFQNPDYSNSSFIKSVINDNTITLVAFTMEMLTTSDEKGQIKLEPLRKLFELEHVSKIKG